MKRLLSALVALCCCLTPLAALADDPAVIELEGASNSSLCYGPPLVLSDGSLLLALGSKPTQASPREGVLLRLAADGSPLWRAPLEDFDRVAGMAEEPGGAVLLTLGFGNSTSRQQRRYALADGSLLWQSEQVSVIDDATLADENLYVVYMPVGERFLREETHDSSASCEPRYYQLETFAGDVLWRVEASELGLSGAPAIALAAPGGTVLIGNAALLLDDAGSVVWFDSFEGTPDALGLPDSFLNAWSLKDGTLLLCFLPRGDERPCDTLLLSLDAATGKELWRRALTIADSPGAGRRLDALLETEQGILLSDSNSYHGEWTGSAYWLLDDSGNPLAYWENVPNLDAKFFSSVPFAWRGEVWAQTEYTWRDEWQLALLRVEIPQ